MKALLLFSLFPVLMTSHASAQTCREVVRDSSGRVVQTIERQKQAGGTERAVLRYSSGQITGSSTIQGHSVGFD